MAIITKLNRNCQCSAEKMLSLKLSSREFNFLSNLTKSEHSVPATSRSIITRIRLQPLDRSENSINPIQYMMKLMVPSIAAFGIITNAYAADVANSNVNSEPSTQDIQTVQMGFKDFNAKRFDDADKEFSIAIQRWNDLNRPRDEIVSLYKARANVRLDNKMFPAALEDYNKALSLMSTDGEKPDGTGRYPEYPDTFVGRALAQEGLADWKAALADYDKAVSLWGGGRGEGVNPFVLTFRGNTLVKLNRYSDAILDYEAASDRFNLLRDVARYSDAKANLALALYQEGRTEEAVKAMKDVVRKNPGYADMHVALAADSWGRGDYITAFNEWRFACDNIDVGCSVYRDLDWISTVRRWPPALAENLRLFLSREIPPALRGDSSTPLAPAPSVTLFYYCNWVCNWVYW
eukprot:gene9990-20777_t